MTVRILFGCALLAILKLRITAAAAHGPNGSSGNSGTVGGHQSVQSHARSGNGGDEICETLPSEIHLIKGLWECN